jgi:hypothetical protein
MFIEFNTIWKTMPPDPLLDNVENNLPPCRGPALLEKEPRKWSRRRIGVLFSKQNGIWTFIVLVGPEKEGLEVDGKGKMEKRPKRGFYHLRVTPDDENVNARGRNGGLVQCTSEQNTSENMMNYIVKRLKRQGPGFLEWIARDVFWGWGEFLKEMRSTILHVISVIRCSF